jgi:leukotriene-A4 hydrolase
LTIQDRELTAYWIRSPQADLSADDAFSRVPYEKGSNFLLHLERTVGGLDVFLPYVKEYVKTFSGTSITTDQWRSHLFDYFGKVKDSEEILKSLGKIDWDAVSRTCRPS